MHSPNPNSSSPPEPPANLLVVDDAPANLQLLVGLFQQEHFKVRPVRSGALALEAVRREPPDLILLDINMPGMNGYEVCKQLKAEKTLRDIPIIFMTASDEVVDKVKAYGLGGVDYITKPFQFREVEARVRTHLTLHRQERQLQERFTQLKEYQHLSESLVEMIVHDIDNPLAAIQTGLEILQASSPVDRATQANLLENLSNACVKIQKMVANLRAIAPLAAGRMPAPKASPDLVVTLRASVAQAGHAAPDAADQ